MASTLRSLAKHLVEKTLVGTGITHGLMRLRRGRVAVLAYHNIVPRGERSVGDRSLHLSQADFGDQLDILCDTHQVVGLDRLFESVIGGEPPFAVITFDDAYLGAMTAGVEELRKRGLEATAFVNPGALEWEGFWWDRLADPERGGLSSTIREHALQLLEGRQEAVLAWARSEGLPLAEIPAHARAAPLAVLESARESGALTLGSHSWSHAKLSSLSEVTAQEEMRKARDWLTEHFLETSDWLSYPYGDQSDAVVRLAQEIHKGALIVSGGLARAPRTDQDWYRVPRVNIPDGISRDGFAWRLAGG